MRKSLFKKYLLTFLLMSLVMIVVFGAVIVMFSGNFWMKAKRDTLFVEARSVAKQISTSNGYYTREILGAVSEASGGDMFITDTSGKVLVSGGRYISENSIVSVDDFSSMLRSETYNIGSLGSKSDDFLIVTVPILTSERTPQYVVFNIVSTDEIWEYTGGLLEVFFIAAIPVILLIMIVAYIITIRIVRPLRDMAQASRRMSRGDFSTFIKVDRQDEIGELAVAFNNMTKSLAQSEQQRRGFIANVSHELKTPMTSISGFIDGIIDGTIPPEETNKYLEIVSNETKRLSRIVVSMLNLSKLEAGEISVKPSKMDLSETILNVMLGFERKISDKSIDVQGLDTLEPIVVTADKDLMYQVIYNLIENAIKYTPDSGIISFSGNNGEDFSSFSIRNTGKGIPEKDLPFIFDRFYKVDKSHGTDRTGTGLGLYLVKTIIAIHGGQISVKSTENKYCEFTVTIPKQIEKGDTSNGSKRKN